MISLIVQCHLDFAYFDLEKIGYKVRLHDYPLLPRVRTVGTLDCVSFEIC